MGSRDEAVAVIKSSFVTLTKRLLLGGLASLGIFGANPIVQTIAGAILDPILKYLSNQGEMGAFFLYIDWRGAAQNEAFVKAAYDNHKAQRGTNKLEKKNAESNLWAAASNFIKYSS